MSPNKRGGRPFDEFIDAWMTDVIESNKDDNIKCERATIKMILSNIFTTFTLMGLSNIINKNFKNLSDEMKAEYKTDLLSFKAESACVAFYSYFQVVVMT